MNLSDPTLDPVQAMLAQASLSTSLFSPTSRYYGLGVGTVVSGGRPVAYTLRRFLPAPERLQAVQVHTVAEGERLDVVTAQYFGDPTLFWRICDAARAMRPWLVTAEPGRKLHITMPQGVTGSAL